MIRLSHVVSCSLLVLPAAACKKEAAATGGGTAAGPQTAASAGGAAKQMDLKAELAGKAMAPLYGVAEPNPGEGNSHRLTFSTRPITCATMNSVLDGAGPGEKFTIRAHEALRPDGTTTWAYGGVASGLGGSAPAGMVAMGGYQIEGARVIGTLPAGVTTEDGPDALVASGSFTVPICDPLPMPKLRDLADIKKVATPIEATGSTARMTVAGKAFDVKGATALAGRDGKWMVRLTAQPHGCVGDIEVPGDLVIVLELGGEEPELFVRGNWIAGSSGAAPFGGTLKADMKASAATVDVTLGGAMDYTPADATYKVELSGAVSATVCTAG
jgi:hypothetical protein